MLMTACLLHACILEEPCRNCPGDETATLRVQITNTDTTTKTQKTQTGQPTHTKAPVLRAFSEDVVGDLHVVVFNQTGELTGHAYGSGSSSVYVTTRSGFNCTVYALVNTAEEGLTRPTSRTALLAMTTPDLTTIESIKVNEHLIMSGSLPADISAGENTLALLPVARLAARNTLNITCAEGTTLTGYAIRNLPVRSWYMPRPNTGEDDAEDDAVGDDAVNTATEADWLNTPTLTPLSTGPATYTITFYQYENRRGGRTTVGGSTGDPTSQSQKATYAPDRATYVELYVNASGALTTHRLYLGANAYTNYSVKRNCTYTYIINIGSTALSITSIGIEGWTPISGGEDIEL
jgi:hypothetical protein